MFFKEKISLLDFCRTVYSDIIEIPKVTYSSYLKSDSEKILSEDEFNTYNLAVHYLRLCLISSFINEKRSQGKIKISDYDLGHTLGKATGLAYQDNNFSLSEMQKKMEEMNEYNIGFLNYLENNKDKEDNIVQELEVPTCMYFTKSITEKLLPDDKNKKFTKISTITALINFERVNIKDYLKNAYKQVKIIG